jgi:heat shock protein HtpX
MSYVKTFGLMALLTALLAGIAGYFGGTSWMVGGLAFAAVFNFGTYWYSDRAVLKMYRARVVEQTDAPELYQMVDRLRRRADLPMPRVAIAPHAQPNAFATGRNPEHAVVCVTEGILKALDREELEGVVAHELAHIKNRDMLTSTVVSTLAAAITLLARFGIFFDRGENGFVSSLLMMYLAPLAAMLIQMGITRSREFTANRDGAVVTGSPTTAPASVEDLETIVTQAGEGLP